jgi:cytochrome P450
MITFSQGPGRCLGQPFNMIEFFAVLDWFLRRYDFALVDATRPVRDVWREISGPEAGGIAIRLRRKR